MPTDLHFQNFKIVGIRPIAIKFRKVMHNRWMEYYWLLKIHKHT